jgi:dihydroxyacetone kinase-like predicted kinase
MLALDPDGDLQSIAAAMESSMHAVRTIELTVATRTAKVDGVAVEAGQTIGLLDDTLVAAGPDLSSVLQQAFEKAGAGSAELATLYYGESMPLPEVNQLAAQLLSRWPSLQVEIHAGGQPHYPIIASIE